jgi:hypothetical protein
LLPEYWDSLIQSGWLFIPATTTPGNISISRSHTVGANRNIYPIGVGIGGPGSWRHPPNALPGNTQLLTVNQTNLPRHILETTIPIDLPVYYYGEAY